MSLLDTLGNLISPNNMLGSVLGGPPSAPTPFDPSQLIALEAQYNRINQNTPFGSLTFANGPNGSTSNMTLSPEYQNLLTQSLKGMTGLLGMGSQSFSDPYHLNNFNPGNFGLQTRRTTNATFRNAMRLLNPQIANDRASLTQSLADRGLPAGSEINNYETTNLNKSINNLRSNAAFSAIQAGQQRQSELYNQALQRYMANQGAEGQNFNQALQTFGANQSGQGNLFNILSGIQRSIPSLNNFFAPSPVDVGGAYGLNANMQNNAYNQQNQNYQGNMGGLFNLGGSLGAAAILSSKKFKDELGDAKVLDKIRKLPVKVWKYKGDKEAHIGPYAEDFHGLFNVGNDWSIHGADGPGVLLAGMKELAGEVDSLKRAMA